MTVSGHEFKEKWGPTEQNIKLIALAVVMGEGEDPPDRHPPTCLYPGLVWEPIGCSPSPPVLMIR